MKQHITTKQLNELSKKGQREWWGFITGDKNHHNGEEENVAKLSTIGQMIQFLDEKVKGVDGYEANLNVEIFHDYDWFVRTCLQRDKKGSDIKWQAEQISEELCDALFEAVKEVLDK